MRDFFSIFPYFTNDVMGGGSIFNSLCSNSLSSSSTNQVKSKTISLSSKKRNNNGCLRSVKPLGLKTSVLSIL